MFLLAWFAMLLGLSGGQTAPPAYVREGDRVITEFAAYRDRLDKFHMTLQSVIERDIPALLPELKDAPPQPAVYGYQLLPRIVANGATEHKPVATFSYSWPITRGYIESESIKLDRAEAEMQQGVKATGVARAALYLSLIASYKSLLDDQRVIDQYIEYNSLWQRAIAEDRRRFDDTTKLYNLLQKADAGTASSIREFLGRPQVPSDIRMETDEENHRVVLHVPIYTDIDSDAFLEDAKTAIEGIWQATDDATSYSIVVEIRKMPAAMLYEGERIPGPGDHIDARSHAARFPSSGLILTTGAEITYATVKRFVALGPGDISVRTLAHEFGHLLGFQDGYIRGYKDLGQQGFEIQELTSVFDDIMSSPREGAVLPAHFKLIVEAIQERNKSGASTGDTDTK